MRRLLPLLALAGCTPALPGGGGIVSTNPCADAILVRLVTPDRIAAISRYSQDPTATSMPIAVAKRFATTAGTAEEVIARKPDLVLTSSFTPMATRDAYARAGPKVLLLDTPHDVAESEAQVRTIASAVHAEQQGAALNAQIDVAVRRWSRPPGGKRPAALLYIGETLVDGGPTLLGDMLARAGFANASAEYGLAYTGTLSTETIVAHPPAIVIAPPSDGRAAAMRRALLPRTPEARYPANLVNCGGPVIVPAMRRLAAIRATLS